MTPGKLAAIRSAAVQLLQSDPEASVDAQALYAAVHAWALRGMGFGIGDHPSTSGEIHVLDRLYRSTEWILGSGDEYGRQRPVRRPVVFDVGANVGEWGAIAMAMFGTAERLGLHCFEPSPAAFAALLDRPEIRRQFRAYPFGLSDTESTQPLHTDTLGSGMASVHPRRLAHFGRSLGVEERATFRRLDDVCREIGVTRIDLLKIDVEGHELAVLRGAGDTLTSGAIGMIQWEMGGCNLDSRTTFQDFWYLLSPRYDLFRVVVDGLVAIPHYREQDEVFICSNFVAIWRAS